MHNAEFLNLLQTALQKHSFDNYDSVIENKIQFFLSELEKNFDDLSPVLQITRTTILFEAFYLSLDESSLKKAMTQVRAQRWQTHFGTPTLPFLLSYSDQIDQIKQIFAKYPNVDITSSLLNLDTSEQVIDDENQVAHYPINKFNKELPPLEITGFFTKTHNPFGGFATTPCDPISQQFIEHAGELASAGGKVLEIGAAFGAASLAAISKGATVYCNDIDVNNLAVVRQRYLQSEPDEDLKISGDTNKLVLIPGSLPDELVGLPNNFFDAILICRVLHFFSGEKIEESLGLLSKLLSPRGKIYIVAETPFLKNWKNFIPEFERRVEAGVEWPGEIDNPAEYESSGRAASLPKFVHWISKEILERSLTRAGLTIEHVDYINRKGQFPEDLLLPEYGKESIGAIAKLG